jgi:innexin
MSILRVLSSVPLSNRPPVHDIIANLHCYFTFNFLIGLAILLSYKQFGGRPIECMTPGSISIPPNKNAFKCIHSPGSVGFSSSWTDYTENYCYTADTYYVKLDQAEQTIVNISVEERKDRRISYYQWIPFFLVFQAACFKLPALIWKYFHAQSGSLVKQEIMPLMNMRYSQV